MKYAKILINISCWHLIPYWLKERQITENIKITEFGWLFFKLIITWK